MYGFLKDEGIAIKTDENIGMEFFEMAQLKHAPKMTESYDTAQFDDKPSSHSSV